MRAQKDSLRNSIERHEIKSSGIQSRFELSMNFVLGYIYARFRILNVRWSDKISVNIISKKPNKIYFILRFWS